MKTSKDTPLYKFNTNTVEVIRKEYNLHNEGVIEELITSFEDWIRKQNHFKKRDFDRRYLETSIISAKGSLERAKNTLDKLCSLKSLQPHFFSKCDAKKELSDTSGLIIQGTMQKLLPNDYRLYLLKFTSADFNTSTFLDFQRFTILMSEYAKLYDYSMGYTCVIDCRDVNLMSLLPKINILDLRNGMTILIEGYSLRINAIHLISASKAVEALVALLRQVISAKIGNRIHVHKTLESLYNHIPKEALPEDLGGNEKTIKEVYENWKNVLSSEENVAYFKDILRAGTDEKYRLVDKYNDQILGMPGSFRSLSVD
ncbi:unnamed protein product [Arctia plantaginis]|uniref:CRAL-TRIO domain-containing protein n=1 Tax=Arctia plantaginis TaxID=874455 RepID=A0A8S0YRR0_ARCPL|nr:unnamed protein product [Arctia plantaginis]